MTSHRAYDGPRAVGPERLGEALAFSDGIFHGEIWPPLPWWSDGTDGPAMRALPSRERTASRIPGHHQPRDKGRHLGF